MKLILSRNVSKLECPWLDHDLAKGMAVWSYEGCTYGCVSGNGRAVSLVDGKTPFFELPRDALTPARKTDPWGRVLWDPEIEPYRVSVLLKSNARGLHGWTHGVNKTFETLEKAREFAATLTRGRVDIDVVVNAATWHKNGNWRLLERVEHPGAPVSRKRSRG